MMNKFDWFKADRVLSERVVEFMRCKVWKKAIQLEYDKKIGELKDSIEKLSHLEGSVFSDKIPEMRNLYLAQIADFEQQREDQIALECKFDLSDFDKTFKKSLAKCGTATDLQAEAVVEWFKNYGLDVSESYFLEEILAFFGGKFDFKTFVATDAQDARKMDAGRALEMVYCSAYTHMLRVGTIKATQIPEIVREKYAPKKAKKAKKDK